MNKKYQNQLLTIFIAVLMVLLAYKAYDAYEVTGNIGDIVAYLSEDMIGFASKMALYSISITLMVFGGWNLYKKDKNERVPQAFGAGILLLVLTFSQLGMLSYTAPSGWVRSGTVKLYPDSRNEIDVAYLAERFEGVHASDDLDPFIVQLVEYSVEDGRDRMVFKVDGYSSKQVCYPELDEECVLTNGYTDVYFALTGVGGKDIDWLEDNKAEFYTEWIDNGGDADDFLEEWDEYIANDRWFSFTILINDDDRIHYECEDGEIQYDTCEDGSEIEWKVCEDGEWEETGEECETAGGWYISGGDEGDDDEDDDEADTSEEEGDGETEDTSESTGTDDTEEETTTTISTTTSTDEESFIETIMDNLLWIVGIAVMGALVIVIGILAIDTFGGKKTTKKRGR